MNIIGAKVNHNKFGNGTVIEVKDGSKATTTLIIEFEEGNKSLSLPLCMSVGALTTEDDNLKSLYEESVQRVKEYEDMVAEELAQKEAEREELARRVMEFKKFKAEKKSRKAQLINTENWDVDTFKIFHSTSIKDVEFDSDYNKFYAIGFIAAHVGKVIADMSDDRESDFVSIFGDVPRNVLDYTDGRSVCQFNLEFPKETVFPNILYEAVCDVKYGHAYTIPRSKFVYDLVKLYGFSFGERQNISDIYEKVDALGFGKAFTEGFNF